MPLSSVSSSFRSRNLLSDVPDVDNSGVQKSKITDHIKMVYGFQKDISNFRKIDSNALPLRALNAISGISDKEVTTLDIFFHKLLSKKLRVDNFFLKKYSDELSIEEYSLKKISEKWIEFLSKHGNKLSLSTSLNKRNKKTENALSDFILKNY